LRLTGLSVSETEEYVIPTYMLNIHLIPIWQIPAPYVQYLQYAQYLSV